MSRWNHAVCENCWRSLNPYQEPHRGLGVNEPERCCYCGTVTQSGIYRREDPLLVDCQGKGKVHDREDLEVSNS